MTLAQIKSTQWQLSTAGPGQVVEGVDDINQAISIIILTVPGSDPLRPLFGCGLVDLIDRPSNVVGADMAASIDKALRLWEPRIKVLKITYRVMMEQIFFSISWQMRIGFQQGQADVLLGLFDSLVKSPIFEDLTPYLSAVLATEDFNPIVNEMDQGLQQ